MGAYGNTGLKHVFDSRQDFLTPFQFDCIASGFFQHTDGIAKRLLFADLVTTKRHVNQHHSMLGGTHHAFGKENHFIHRDRQCVLIATDDVGSTVTHQQDINTRFIH